jgi:hypothetical protein
MSDTGKGLLVFSTKAQIQQRAYEIYLQRGCDDGHDVEDWLAAENELKNVNAKVDSIPRKKKAATAGQNSR